jgi:hypothetical protein
MPSILRILRVVLTSDVWTPITVPAAARNIALVNSGGQDVLMRSDPNDPATEDTFLNQAQLSMLVPQTPGLWEPQQFVAGAVLIYLKPVDGSPATVVLRYL